MPSSQPLDESTILSRFLLQPSSLPTILPYKAFLNLLPTSTRNDPSLSRTLRKIYTDLQFQRSIDVDNVRANIDRECARSGTLKARLRKEVAREMDGSMDDDEDMIIHMTSRPISETEERREEWRNKRREQHGSPEIEMSRKRKRSVALASDEGDEDDNEKTDHPNKTKSRSASRRASSPAEASVDSEEHAEASNSEIDRDDVDDNSNDEEEEEEEIAESPTPSSPPPSSAALSPLSSSPPPTPNANNTHHLDPLFDRAFHGPRGLALPSTYTSQQPHSAFHTRSSLLSAMASAIQSLDTEIEGLDAEANDLLGKMRETVGGLSDLRYGRFATRESDGMPGLTESVEEGLRELCAVVVASR